MIEVIRRRLAAIESKAAPKYQVLRDVMLDVISSGEWAPGMQLPTEAELAKILPYSLGTVQKAYGELVKNGVVTRTRARGSFVAPPHRQMSEPWHCRFLDDDDNILPIYPRFLRHRVAEPNPRWPKLFGPRAKVLRIDRAISISREFEVLSRFFAVETVIKPLLRLSPKGVESANFKAILMRELAMPIARIVQTIAIADRRLWHQLGIRSRPHLLLEAIAYTRQDQVAYFQELYIPPNRRRLLFDSEYRIG